MFPVELLNRAASGEVIEIKIPNGIIILYSNKQWEFISDKKKRTVV